MELEGVAIQKTFRVKHRKKTYDVNFVDGTLQTLALLNRDNWEVTDEDGEELQIYTFKGDSKKKKEVAKKNTELMEKLVSFCKRNFNKFDEKLVGEFKNKIRTR